MDIILGISPGIAKLATDLFQPNESGIHFDKIDGVMFSYANVKESSREYRKLWKQGFHRAYKLPTGAKVFLDNGSYNYATDNTYDGSLKAYENFVEKIQPYWAAQPRDYIPNTAMSSNEIKSCFERTMGNNEKYCEQDYAMILHPGPCFELYLDAFKKSSMLSKSKFVSLGSILGEKSSFNEKCYHISKAREAFPDSHLHILGIGGTRSMVNLSVALGVDAQDSVGWQMKAQRFGHVISPNPAKGTLNVATHLNDRQKLPSKEDYADLEACECPYCEKYGLKMLEGNEPKSAVARIGHNLWHLTDERDQTAEHVKNGTYDEWQKKRNPKLYNIIRYAQERSKVEQLSLF